MSKQHKWHKEIKAWADGAEIEVKWKGEKEWWKDDDPAWGNDDCIFRLKEQLPLPFNIHLWKLAGGLLFDLREPDPKTMILDFYLGSIQLNNYTKLAMDTKNADINQLLGVPKQ